WRWSDGRLLPALFAGSAVATLGLLGWLAARQVRTGAIAPLTIAAGLMFTATFTSQQHLRNVGEVSANQATAAGVVRALGSDAPRCLAHDRAHVSTYVMWLYRMQLPDIEHRRVDLAAGE